MALLDDLKKDVTAVFHGNWKLREGQKVPEAVDIKLGNDAVTLDGVVLYADLRESTALVDGFKPWFAAEVYKAYLLCAAKIIRSEGGEITAYDGDRVMAVFIGDQKVPSAIRAALKINWAVKKIINPGIKAKYTDCKYEVQQAVGIDSGSLFVARTGIRGANDLVWVGRAANYAAKLCSVRDGTISSWITKAVYDALTDDTKYGQDRQLMWVARPWTAHGVTIYGSTFWWPIT